MRLSPDGWYYLRAAGGEAVPWPYSCRWLLPQVLGDRPRLWAAVTYLSLAVTPALAWGYFGSMGLSGWVRWFAVALLCCLPGWRLSLRFPVLIDAPSFALTLAAAWAVRADARWHGVPLAILLGGMRESGPIFAALWAWSPWPLVGLLAVGWPWRRAPPDQPWLEHPFREALKLRRDLGLDGGLYLRPWGAALAGLAAPSWQLGATLAVAYGQLVQAQDTVRLYFWAAPVLVGAAARVIPVELWALALVWTVVHREDRA